MTKQTTNLEAFTDEELQKALACLRTLGEKRLTTLKCGNSGNSTKRLSGAVRPLRLPLSN